VTFDILFYTWYLEEISFIIYCASFLKNIHRSKTTTNYISTQTTESLQSTTKRTKEDTIYNDQITGNIMGIYVVNRDDITPYYVKADDEYSLKNLHNK
jgi:hypothetical protein